MEVSLSSKPCETIPIEQRTTLARARYVTRLDAVPPGQHATSTSPTRSAVGNASAVPIQYLSNPPLNLWEKNMQWGERKHRRPLQRVHCYVGGVSWQDGGCVDAPGGGCRRIGTHPNVGMTVYCMSTPAITAFGICNCGRRSRERALSNQKGRVQERGAEQSRHATRFRRPPPTTVSHTASPATICRTASLATVSRSLSAAEQRIRGRNAPRIGTGSAGW